MLSLRNLYTAGYIVGYAHYLVMKAQLAGNLRFDGHKASVEEQNIGLKLRELSSVIGRRLSVCREDEIADLLDSYDLTFRIGYRRLPDESMINRHRLRLLRAWRSKRKFVEESSVFSVISSGVRGQYGNLGSDFADEADSILKKWIAVLMLHSSFPDASSYEAYQRLALLMPLDLNPYLGDDVLDFKQKCYEAYKVGNLSLLNSRILCSYRRFIGSLPVGVLHFEEQKLLEIKVLRELSRRNDLDPHYREAFRMALKFTEELIRL